MCEIDEDWAHLKGAVNVEPIAPGVLWVSFDVAEGVEPEDSWYNRQRASLHNEWHVSGDKWEFTVNVAPQTTTTLYGASIWTQKVGGVRLAHLQYNNVYNISNTCTVTLNLNVTETAPLKQQLRYLGIL